jgi:2-polyprenyl-6-methoxyphenol hydroxylase-like FAD-dependent oxidoreductase
VAPDGNGMTGIPDILIVGAGPTGLTLALQAHALGARVRIVERRPREQRPSRALLMQARTWEVLSPLGVGDALLARADTAPRVDLRFGDRMVAVDATSAAVSASWYPAVSVLRQADVEAVLTRALSDCGIQVDQETELVALNARPGSETAVLLRHPTGPRALTASWIVGCDGAGSTVRALAGIGWRGGQYRQEVLLADLELDGESPPDKAQVAVGRDGSCFLFPCGEQAPWRLVATRPATHPPTRAGEPGPPVPADDLQRLMDGAGIPARATAVAWSSKVSLRYGLASTYRKDMIFLAGDAAHLQSPAGGQGMNTGIQDAVNLGWKLALAPGSSRPADLLESYEQERRPVARRIRRWTDLALRAESGTDPLTRWARTTVVPAVAPFMPPVLRRHRLIDPGLRRLSQLDIDYRRSVLSTQQGPGRLGGIRAGDRLPDRAVIADGRRTTLHQLIAQPGIHLLLERDACPTPLGLPDTVHVHRLSGVAGCGLMVVRPDGYVGMCAPSAGASLTAWLALAGADPLGA